MSSRVDDRSMHELYLWPFADSVKAGVSSVMCSYNKINGSCTVYCSFLFFSPCSLQGRTAPCSLWLLNNTQ